MLQDRQVRVNREGIKVTFSTTSPTPIPIRLVMATGQIYPSDTGIVLTSAGAFTASIEPSARVMLQANIAGFWIDQEIV